jgi:thioredoxin reductase (NADPH)
VIVIGGGPAGLSAAIYTRRALLTTLILEKRSPGGQLNETDLIENYPGFADAIKASTLTSEMTRQAERLGARIAVDEASAVRSEGGRVVVKTASRKYAARAVILATGSQPIKLPAQGAERLAGKGVSYCATCDGFFFQDARLLVVGAGDSGLTEAIYLSRIARSVGIVVRHPQNDPHALRASPTLQLQARQMSNIHFEWNVIVEEVHGEDRVTGATLRDLTTGERRTEAIDGLFVSIGHVPATAYLRGTVDLDEKGYILTNEHRETSMPRVFAAGDARSGIHEYAQAVVAASDGAVAAIEVERQLAREGGGKPDAPAS